MSAYLCSDDTLNALSTFYYMKSGKTDEEKAVDNLETSDMDDVVAKLSPSALAKLKKALK